MALHLHFDLLIVPPEVGRQSLRKHSVTASKRKKAKTNYSKALFILPHGENDLIKFFSI